MQGRQSERLLKEVQMQYNYAIFIGRFQPFHNAHRQIVDEALKIADKLIIVIGSHNAPQSLRNPFDTMIRRSLIIRSLSYEQAKRVDFVFIQDSAYNFEAWLLDIKKKISDKIGPLANRKIVLVGNYKDDTSYYLNHFPEWDFQPVHTKSNLSSTDIRAIMYENNESTIKPKLKSYVASDVISYLQSTFYKSQDYKSLREEYEYVQKYKAQWKTPFPPTFITTDAVVFCMGYVLVVDRKMNPGKGCIALPGGFLGNECIFDSCLRELREETKLDISYKQLKGSLKEVKVFDHPLRDPRGRIVTHGHFFRIEDAKLPVVEGGDDAAKAYWFPLHELEARESQFFSDHAQIIKYFINRGN